MAALNAVPGSLDPIAEARRQWLAHWDEAVAPSMTAVTSIMRVHQILLARLNTLLKPWGLSFARYEALMLLYYSRRGSLPLGKMGERLQVHPTSVTNLIDGLERLGLVAREAHETDRRATLASITEDGRKVSVAATERLNEARFCAAPLTTDELEQLTGTLRRIRLDAGDFAPD
jgi:DNA-binding MarR family transcriptional regulator